ncbi:MAG: MlaE family ABC transporter permease [Beijerinckiaceae bacterium]
MSASVTDSLAAAAVPRFTVEKTGNGVVLLLDGDWDADHGTEAEEASAALRQAVAGAAEVVVNFAEVDRLDTLGAWLIDRLAQERHREGLAIRYDKVSAEHGILLKEIGDQVLDVHSAPPPATFVDFTADIGRTVVQSGKDVVSGVAFLGEIIAAFGSVIMRPSNFRVAAFVTHIEQIGLRGVPIITLISFLVGGIVAQQGIFQLQRFGATAFVVDLIGVLSLRELAVLLTAIMVAGRSGSAFTAEIGSMKMREEIDALRVMGLNPVEVLVVPRLVALIICLPLLTFLAAIASLFGGGLVAWIYGGLSPEVFLARLQTAIAMNTFLVGLIKAPFMAVVIGVIACIEGLKVQGSAESLGRQVTSSVVKAIFIVIVVDGLFAMFFAAIKY